MLFMVIERFRGQDGKAVYRHFRDKGRQMPEGLKFGAASCRRTSDGASSSWSATT
jgi:hypothetical protein